MGCFRASCKVLFCFFFLVSSVYQFLPIGADGNQTAQLIVDTKGPGRKMPETLFGLFFEVNFFTYISEISFISCWLLPLRLPVFPVCAFNQYCFKIF